MRAIISYGSALLLGSVGWWLGEKVNAAVGVMLSGIASGVGLYYGRKWFDDNLG